MGTAKTTKWTMSLLKAYSEATARNAQELLQEACLLRDHNHMARAYFLAVSCVEETGKALLVFDAQLRNLSDPAVCKKMQSSMENHGQKINYALGVWAINSPDPRASVKVALDLIIELKYGREPSMYTDLSSEPLRVQTPRDIVRSDAARDCVRLAEHCLAYALTHIQDNKPAEFSKAQNNIFTMKSAKYREIANTENFWWYYLSCMEGGIMTLQKLFSNMSETT